MSRKFPKPVYTFLFEEGGAWVPNWLKKPNMITVEGSHLKVWAARYLHNEHLIKIDDDGVPRQLTYDSMGNKPKVVTTAWKMTLLPKLVLVAMVAVLMALHLWVLAVVAPVAIAGYSALIYKRRPMKDIDGNVEGRFDYWLQYAWELLCLVAFTVISTLLLAISPFFMAVLAPIAGAVLYLNWVFGVAAIQLSRVTRYWRVYSRELDYAEASDINGVSVRFPTPRFIFRKLDIKTIIIYRNSKPPLKLKWIPNGETVHDLIVGIHLSIPRADRAAGDNQEIGNKIAAASAMAGRPLTVDEIAEITGDRDEALRLHSIIFKDSGQPADKNGKPTAEKPSPDDTPTEPIPRADDGLVHHYGVVGRTDHGTVVREVEEPKRMHVVGSSGSLGTMEVPPKVNRWRKLAHTFGLHSPFEERNSDGIMVKRCPQCNPSGHRYK